ncbi:acyltransferase [Dokdonella sp.]|uniref:acyltransferase family protein n=1 Tax=Dokdonella sp. TaxID=2291710 RepID=UPI0025BE03FB|nr:acyltransferase [Dokdonella sp.]MBX3689911.1 acyltransferase [Dokdonella sp.]
MAASAGEAAGMSAQAAPMGVAPDQRLRHIDALRGIAALLVLWRHVADAFVTLGPGVCGRWISELGADLDFGRIGVVTFFLISGYVIPFSIHPERPAPIGSFLIKRFWRIFPAYWLSIPLGAFATWWLWQRAFGAREFLVNLSLLQDLFGVPGALGLYWTLLVEWMFYLLCVILLLVGSFAKPRHWLLLSLVLMLAWFAEMLYHWASGVAGIGSVVAFQLLNLSLMLLGALARSHWIEAGDDPLVRKGVIALLLWHLLVLPVGTSVVIGVGNNAAIPYALGVALFVVGISVVRIRSRLTDWLGRVSYSLYLFHPVVFMIMLWGLLRLPADSIWRNQHLGVYLFANALLAAGVATLVHHWVERPGIELGRRLARGWVRWWGRDDVAVAMAARG